MSFALLPFPLFYLPSPGARVPASEPWTVLLSGDADGYIAPCGCTSPQQGGLKRRATALRGGDRVVRLDNGGLAEERARSRRQTEIKAETAAQALDLSQVDAANFAGRDAVLGANEAMQLARLSGGRLVSTSFRPSGTAPVPAWREAGPFLIGGATERTDLLVRDLHEQASEPLEAAHRLVEEAASRSLTPILLFDGDRAAAAVLARGEPALRLVTYRSSSRPSMTLERIGDCALASPGEHGKAVVRLTWSGTSFAMGAVETLGPTFPDDKEAEGLYKGYLKRVSDERLLEKFPHLVGRDFKAFSGNAKCGSCHKEAKMVWQKSGHVHALKTLEEVGHHRDPDCVRCHVVGKDAERIAFVSRATTPQLTDVGCESCHGAGAGHSTAPRRVKMPKVGSNACKPCHTLENSPNFDFAVYWPKVKHGR